MPSCAVCGGSEFEARDGLFFCSVCMTQSQDLRQEEAGEDFMDMTNPEFRHLIRNKEYQKGKKTIQSDKGRPWSGYEGFQIIMKEQVKALIRLGANPKLKDVVFHLWCTYLAKMKVAFTEDLEQTDLLLTKFKRHREKYPGTTDDPDIKPVMLHRMMKKKMTASVADSTANIENKDFELSLRDEELYDDDNLLTLDPDTESVNSVNLEGEQQRISGLNRQAYMQHPGFMNMKKTLAFCHIGLMYTNPVTTAVDIIRWVHDDEIPYKNASCLLPTNMKFGPYDCNTFRATLPVCEDSLRKISGSMIRYLDLHNVPMTPIKDLINKYLVLLNLPGDLHGYIHKIEKLMEYEKRYRCVGLPSYDSIAMAFIITTLEILIGLDGSTESKLSKISKKIENLLEGVRLFAWDDWVSHTNKTQKLTLTRLMSQNFDMRHVDNVEKMTVSLQNLQRRVGRHTDKQTLKQFQLSSQDALLLPLKMLSEKMCTPAGGSNNPEEPPIQESAIRSHDIKNFRTCRLKHLTQPKYFSQLLNKEIWRDEGTTKEKDNDENNENCIKITDTTVSCTGDNTSDSHAGDTTVNCTGDNTSDSHAGDMTVSCTGDNTSDSHAGDTTVSFTGDNTSDSHAGDTTVNCTGDNTSDSHAGDTTVSFTGDNTSDSHAGDTTVNCTGDNTSDSHAGDTTVSCTGDNTSDSHAGDTTVSCTGDNTSDSHAGDTTVSFTGDNTSDSHTIGEQCDILEKIQVTDKEIYDTLTDRLVEILNDRRLQKDFGRKCLQTSKSSYRWLVKKCAVLIETSDTDLNRHINQIQNALLKFCQQKSARKPYFKEEFVDFLFDFILNI
ncbi:uncharacterized protein [Argopecten irradians]|uniref:uncharacterized protein isoform X2 n=1 Tax=Argopecten irradians TaxID=31199 RepID=UPI00371C9652